MRRPLLLLLVPCLLLLAGCGDDGDDVATGATGSSDPTEPADGPTDGPAEGPTTCEDLDVAVIDQVEDPGPADTRPEGAPPPPEELQEAEDAAAALRRVAEGGPEELRADADLIADFSEIAIADPEGHDEPAEPLVPARQRLAAWGIEHCELPGPIWSCTPQGTFRTGGAPVELDTGETPVGDPAEVVGRGAVDPTWEVVEVERTERRVTFAWLDADGLAVRSETAAAWSGHWTSDQTTTCQVLQPVAPEGPVETLPDPLPPPQPAGEDDLPQASSTSTP